MYRTLGQLDISTLPLTAETPSVTAPSLSTIYSGAPQNAGYFNIPYSQISLVTPQAAQPVAQTGAATQAAIQAGQAAAAAANKNPPPAPAPSLSSQFSTWLGTGNNKLILAAAATVIVVILASKRRR